MEKDYTIQLCGMLIILLAVIAIAYGWPKEQRYESPNPELVPVITTQTRAEVANLDSLWDAICQIESNHNPRAINGDAVGIAQIRPICLEDCNRIIGHEQWVKSDRFDPEKSKEMFVFYTDYWSDGSDEQRARVWFGGPRMLNSDEYWLKVQEKLNEKEN